MAHQYCSYCNKLLKVLDCCPMIPVKEIFLEQGLESFGNFEFVFNIFMVLISAVPWIFSLVVLFNFLIQRNRRTLLRLITHSIAHIFCDTVKVLIFQEPRPEGACDTKYGMPSCHSIFGGLYTTWILLEILVYPKRKWTMIAIMEIFLMLLVPYSRMFLNYHSQKQVMAGWAIGVAFSIIGWLIYFATANKEEKKKKY